MAKQFTFICVPGDTAPRATRLIRGTLREVESKLRGEWEIRRATAEDGYALAASGTKIEDASNEPV